MKNKHLDNAPTEKQHRSTSSDNLNTRKEKLVYVSSNYNPYDKLPSEKMKKTLLEFQLDPLILDPFTITNKLLVLLDEVEQELKQQHHQ